MNIGLKVLVFVLATISIAWVSRSSLRNPRFHGFYRFFAWETILVLFLVNMDYWFIDPFTLPHTFSWFFLIVSLVLIVLGVRMFQRIGKIDRERQDPGLVGIEKTTELVTTGVYRYIRHPFYSSLLFLAWGIMLKRVAWLPILLALSTTIFLLITARIEERENIHFFGDKYQIYMKETRMFIPYIF
jgi:protein-S-isoprenylcysteine O-methyltransferase Ste14